MNAVLVAVGSAGDVHPFVGLGIALRRRGHRVTLITGSYFESLARRAGLDFVSFASVEEYRELIEEPHMWGRWRGFITIARKGIVPAIQPIFEAVRDLFVPGDTVVAASTLALGARIAQEKLGVPLATVHLSPVVFRSDFVNPVLPGMLLGPWVPAFLKRFQYWLVDVVMVDRLIGPSFNAFRAEHGLPPVRRLFDEWFHSPQANIGLFPNWFAPAQPDWPKRTVLTGFPLYDERGVSEPSQELVQFLDAGGPPVVFTPGSAMVHGQQFFAEAAAACELAGLRGILLTRFASQVPADLPATVRHFDYVPFSWLLPRAAALVHHGGIGTLSQGMAAGLPQVVMPMSFDQPDNAQRLKRLGAGTYLWPRQFRAARVARHLTALLDSPDVKAACRRVADRIANDQPLDATCEILERLVEKQAGRVTAKVPA